MKLSINYGLIGFILLNILLITLLTWIAYTYHNYTLKKNNKETKTFIEFINNGSNITFKSIFIGLSFGLIFGFMDNLGLWIGIDKLEKFMPGGSKTKAALGNTYSDFLGATLGTSISIILNDYFSVDDDMNTPIWVNTIGIILGCLIGLITGRLIIGDNK